MSDRGDGMRIIPEKRLFWFLKEGVKLDLHDPPQLDMYIQQVVTHGRTEDVQRMLKRTWFGPAERIPDEDGPFSS